ncbi:uncharacterized protein LOC115742577 [Rhodamnia argentea]|uniref:Uncharacterized protein LOC115742577 n=1 Tax=Rhodamnia argentea TaxID=178133 RepID=A0A8B8PDD2_9MYRT|nr:uncharacterized protein LOC115742577 [Rhodamnia argentea]
MFPTESVCATAFFFFFFFWAAILSAPVASSAGEEGSPSAYEVLQSYGFPVGLLPKGIMGYELDEATGEFTASLNGTCSFTLENSYQLKYERSIEGVIERERLRRLKGVNVKVTVVWLSIGFLLFFFVVFVGGVFVVRVWKQTMDAWAVVGVSFVIPLQQTSSVL